MTYKTVALLAEAEHKAQAVRKYDQNYALKLSGLNELTPVQSEAFEKWWSCFISEMMRDACKDDPLFWLTCFKGHTLTEGKHRAVKRNRNGEVLPVP